MHRASFAVCIVVCKLVPPCLLLVIVQCESHRAASKRFGECVFPKGFAGCCGGCHSHNHHSCGWEQVLQLDLVHSPVEEAAAAGYNYAAVQYCICPWRRQQQQVVCRPTCLSGL